MKKGLRRQLSKYSCIMHLFVSCKVNLYIYSKHIAFSFCFYLTGHGFNILTKTTSGSNISTQNKSARISYKLSYRHQTKVKILTLLTLGLIYLKNLPKMRMSEKCRNNKNNNSDNPLTSRRTNGGKNHSPKV